ncbi:MAG: uroporphyrinogen decarboxylase [Armatimonadota bacterium]|nr:uroporphyrinogen decarboxylase [Armatimonadota bacterium]MDR7532875.1 uroporphyrinogen decarboxylase [Armatimonadota bacterium]MDR7536082.1 uroporphyrinogen decarboxylase [Armatimonadota bacterium]
MTDRFLRACRCAPTDRTPVWFMRQAGRALPEYRALRERYTLLDLCRTPALAAQMTVLPVQRLGVDAAILFADITLPLVGMGVAVDLVDGVGPVISEPLRSPGDVDRLRPLEPERDLPFVLEAISLVRRDCPVPLIGFAGAPFTLASYLVEGRGARDLLRTKRLLHGDPVTWHALLARLTDATLAYLRAQVAAGAQAVQVFDSWVGALAPRDYAAGVLPHMRRLFAGLATLDVPAIHFGTGTAGLLSLMAQAGGDVIGVDWRVRLGEAWAQIGPRAIQGNLDPAVLLAPFPVVEAAAREILDEAAGRPGHIFNLGHGVLPQTPPEHLARLVALVHETTAAAAPAS